MDKPRRDGVYLVLLGVAMFLLLGIAMERSLPVAMMDFKAVYYGARCLLHHSDPYASGEILRSYLANGERIPSDPVNSQVLLQGFPVCVNLPTALLYAAPFNLLGSFGMYILPLAIAISSFVFAAFLMWHVGAEYAPLLCGALIGILVANSEILVASGNLAGPVVGFCAIAVWCFVRQRYVFAGVLCLALSLALKPHDTWLVWVYLVLAGGVYRKYALQTLLAVCAFALPAVLWVSRVSPHWLGELESNLRSISAPGRINDPALAAQGQHALGMQIGLESLLSAFYNRPGFYTAVSWLICAGLLLVLAAFVARIHAKGSAHWLALAAVAALSMLPSYHRPYDAKLLLLTVPACSMLWAERKMLGRIAAVLSLLAILFTGDLLWILLLIVAQSLHISAGSAASRVLTALWIYPAPALLLAQCVFFLVVFVQRSKTSAVRDMTVRETVAN